MVTGAGEHIARGSFNYLISEHHCNCITPGSAGWAPCGPADGCTRDQATLNHGERF